MVGLTSLVIGEIDSDEFLTLWRFCRVHGQEPRDDDSYLEFGFETARWYGFERT